MKTHSNKQYVNSTEFVDQTDDTMYVNAAWLHFVLIYKNSCYVIILHALC